MNRFRQPAELIRIVHCQRQCFGERRQLRFHAVHDKARLQLPLFAQRPREETDFSHVDVALADQPFGKGSHESSEKVTTIKRTAQPEQIVGNATRKQCAGPAQFGRLIAGCQQRHRIDLAFSNDPQILAAVTCGHRQLHRSGIRCDPDQPARHQMPRMFIFHQKRTDSRMTTPHSGRRPDGNARSGNFLLSHIGKRLGPNPRDQSLTPLVCQIADDEFFAAALLECRLDHEFLQSTQYHFQACRVAAPPRRNGRHFQRFTQQSFAKLRQKCHEHGSTHDSTAGRIGNGDIS